MRHIRRLDTVQPHVHPHMYQACRATFPAHFLAKSSKWLTKSGTNKADAERSIPLHMISGRPNTHTRTLSSHRVNSPRTPRLAGRRREFIYSKCTRKTASSRLVRLLKALCAEKSIGRDNLLLKCHQQETVGVSPSYLRRDSGGEKKKEKKRNPTLNPSAIPTEA